MREDVVRERDVDAQLKALAHPYRLKILRLLKHDEMTNRELAALVEVVPGQLHYHTQRLLDVGLIARVEREGREVPYRLATPDVLERVRGAIAQAMIEARP